MIVAAIALSAALFFWFRGKPDRDRKTVTAAASIAVLLGVAAIALQFTTEGGPSAAGIFISLGWLAGGALGAASTQTTGQTQTALRVAAVATILGASLGLSTLTPIGFLAAATMAATIRDRRPLRID